MTDSKQNDSITLQQKRTLAKAGMATSMGVILWTALRRNRRVMRYHTLAGIALMGFSAWHMMLYNGKKKRASSGCKKS
jgi:L-serine deaminase